MADLLRDTPGLTLEAADRLIAAGKDKAAAIGSPSNITVVDAFGFLLAHARMDGAPLPSIEHAINKAYTSALFAKPTADMTADAEPGGDLYGLNLTLNQRVVVFGGGVPILHGDKVVGAVGVSGGTSAQDHDIASTAAETFAKLL